MEEFNTIEGVKNLFGKVNCVGQNNCYFISYVNLAVSFGLLGGFISGMQAKIENKCDGYLVNQTENGIGLIPLLNSGISGLVNYSPSKMRTNIDSFVFIKQEEIKKISIRKANLISIVSKEVTIELVDGRKYKWIVNNNEKLIPYHAENFDRFVSMYKK